MPDWLQIALFVLGWLLAGIVVARIGLRLALGNDVQESDAPVVLLCVMVWPLIIAITPLILILAAATWLVARPSWNPWKREDSK
jgi:hypothetical protein